MSDHPPAPPELRAKAVRLSSELHLLATDAAALNAGFKEFGLMLRRQTINTADEMLERLRKHRNKVDDLGKTLKQIRDDLAATNTTTKK